MQRRGRESRLEPYPPRDQDEDDEGEPGSSQHEEQEQREQLEPWAPQPQRPKTRSFPEEGQSLTLAPPEDRSPCDAQRGVPPQPLEVQEQEPS
jgi:hypothetical protein